jgi:hypothetical protein
MEFHWCLACDLGFVIVFGVLWIGKGRIGYTPAQDWDGIMGWIMTLDWYGRENKKGIIIIMLVMKYFARTIHVPSSIVEVGLQETRPVIVRTWTVLIVNIYTQTHRTSIRQ